MLTSDAIIDQKRRERVSDWTRWFGRLKMRVINQIPHRLNHRARVSGRLVIRWLMAFGFLDVVAILFIFRMSVNG